MPSTFVTVPWQTGHYSSLVITSPNGTKRTLHLVKSAPKQGGIESPDIEILFVCEYDVTLRNPDGSYGRYRAPSELWATPIYGSPRGDTGYRIPGVKHGGGQLRLKDTGDQVQVLSTSRQVEGGPFVGQITIIPEIPVIG